MKSTLNRLANKPYLQPLLESRLSEARTIVPASSVKIHALPVVALKEAKIYAQYPKTQADSDDCIFPTLSFSLDSLPGSKERWAIISADSLAIKTKFLQTLQGHYISVPSTARSWSYLSSNEYMEKSGGTVGQPSRKLRYVGFKNLDVSSGGSNIQGAYLGARYESRREDTDWRLIDYLRGTVNLNLSDMEIARARGLEESADFQHVIKGLELSELLRLPVGSLSNGQNRRARIAKALLEKPEVLLLDEPFAGLDPVNRKVMARLLEEVAKKSDPRVILALQAQEAIPDWITKILQLDSRGNTIGYGDKNDVLPHHEPLLTKGPTPVSEVRTSKRGSGAYNFQCPDLQKKMLKRRLKGSKNIDQYEDDRLHHQLSEFDQKHIVWKRHPDFIVWDQDISPKVSSQAGEPLVEMSGVKVSYGSQCVLGDWQSDQDGHRQDGLHWTVRRGDRWGIFGANGSGKTTLISLLTSDHPQAYSLPVKIFGRSRLPSPSQPGISIFDIQARIGHSSPEIHTHFPKDLSIRQVIESAWAEAFYSRPKIGFKEDEQVSSALRWFRHELDPSMATKHDPVAAAFQLDGNWQIRYERQVENRKLKSKYAAWHWEDPDWADEILFRECEISAQRVALFLRAVIKKPDIVVLDEAFSGMEAPARLKCMLWLAHGEEMWIQGYKRNCGKVRPKRDTNMKRLGLLHNTGLEPRQALICVSHRKEDVPFVVNQFLRLPEANEGKPASFGPVDRHYTRDWWERIWDIETAIPKIK